MDRSQQRIAVVTGANRGLGLETATELARRGMKVLMLGRDHTKIAAAAKILQTQGLDVEAHCVDVAEDKTIREFASWLGERHDGLEVLVNNAGVLLESRNASRSVPASVFDVPPDVVAQSFDVNALGPLRMCQALVPLMRKRNYGRVVNVSSGMGALTGMEGQWPGYRMSKAALNALTRILAVELKDTNIKVNAVCPGWVRTDMGGANADRSVAEGAAGIVWAAMLDDRGPSGGFFRDGKAIDW